MATIKDVAQAAGVSFKTVSRVINNDPQVSDDLRQRVLRAIEDLDYRPNLAARHMRTQKTHFIGLITDQIATTPFSGNIIKGAQEAAWKHGKILLTINTDSQLDIETTAINLMLERQVEGIIFAAMFHRVINPPHINGVPVVLLDCYSQDRRLPFVVPDEVDGGFHATEYLLRKGHRRIGIINGRRDFPATEGRLEGYKQALEAFGIPIDENLIRYGGWWQEDGYDHCRDIMNQSEPPTALFCGNDRIAMGAYDALRHLGLRIPDDVAVVGYDNMEVIAAHLNPRLTTMALPHYEMGQWAVDYLIENTRGQGLEPIEMRIKCPLIKRESA